MINKKYLKLLRSIQRFDENNFIYKTVAKRIIDSIDLINIKLDNVLEVGINENKIIQHLKNRYYDVNIDRADLCLSKSNTIKKFNFLEIDLDNFSFKNNYYNLVYSNCFIHLTNNFEQNLKIIMNGMQSNSFFIAAIPDKNSMYQILNSMYETDLYFYKGAYQRFNPTIDIEKILSILKKLNFDTPSIYSDSFVISYSTFIKLIKDIQTLNLSYCYNDKKQNFENKKYFNVLEKFYRKKYFDGSFNLDLKINIISAWKK